MPVTLIGLVLGWAVVFGSQVMEGGNPASLFHQPAPLVLVFGGSLAAALTGYRAADFKALLGSTKRAVLPGKEADPVAAIEQLAEFAATARREGLIALDSAASNVEDPFLRRGLQLIVDGRDPDEVADVLEADLAATGERHKVGAGFYGALGAYAPTLGIIGTVMGLVHVLEHLSEPSSLGPAIASAFIATLWGVSSANLMWLPVAAKLKRMAQAEASYRMMLLDGLLALQSGAAPSELRERLKSHLAPAQRVAMVDGGGAAGKK